MAKAAGDNQKDVVKEAVKQFVDASMNSEKPDLDEFVKQYPGLESEIRRGIQELNKINNLFDSLVMADDSDFEDISDEHDLIGKKVGGFEIEKIIGRGGMGVVYLANDTKLKRSVAIKSIPAALADDSTARMRLRREAELLASLNHPNIAVIHEIIEEDKSGYLILEHVEGETLAERIARGPLKLQEALSISRQVAEAISAAHEKGVVHRDLKPGNIKITPDGRIKVLDFGLAKTTVAGTGSGEVTDTQPGRIIGTPAYMSPEQARGQPIDKRSDIWSFGCVLYEMLTGKVLFKGDTASDTLANILKTEPDFELLPAGMPANIRILLRRCLQKDPSQRLHDIADARIEISETQSDSLETNVPPDKIAAATPRLFQRNVILVALVCLIAGVLITGAIFMNLVRPDPLERTVVSRLSINLPADKQVPLSYAPNCFLAISPDGSSLVYGGKTDNGDDQLYLRSLNSLDITPIPGTEGAHNPFFSPDGQWIGFFVRDAKALKKIPLTGGEPVTLTNDIPASGTAFGSWAEDRTIVISAFRGSQGLHCVSDDGGTLECLMPPDTVKNLFLYPQVLPGAKAILYTRRFNRWVSTVEVFFPETGKREIVIGDADCGKYVHSGHLLFVRDNIVMGVPFDVKRCKKTGPIVSLLGDVQFDWAGSAPQIAVSENGTAVYVLNYPPDKYEIIWVDRRGQVQSSAVPPYPLWGTVRLSPDERHIAMVLNAPKRYAPQIHLFDLERGTKNPPLTTEGINKDPRWSPDGSKVAFWFNRPEGKGVFCKSVNSSDPPELLASDPSVDIGWLGSWSHDGKSLVCLARSDPNTKYDLWIIPVDGERTPKALCQTDSNENNPRFSPDGRWLAYVSDESGKNEVYLMPCLPRLDFKRRFPVSSGGGRLPIWSRDASELYYSDGEGMIAVKIGSDPNKPLGSPEQLFLFADLNAEVHSYGRVSAVSRDGRFLVSRKVTDEPHGRQLICIQNWFEELKRLAPTEK